MSRLLAAALLTLCLGIALLPAIPDGRGSGPVPQPRAEEQAHGYALNSPLPIPSLPGGRDSRKQPEAESREVAPRSAFLRFLRSKEHESGEQRKVESDRAALDAALRSAILESLRLEEHDPGEQPETESGWATPPSAVLEAILQLRGSHLPQQAEEEAHEPAAHRPLPILPPRRQDDSPVPFLLSSQPPEHHRAWTPMPGRNRFAGPGAPVCAENGSCFGDISELTGRPKTVYVRGYYRRDGTYVRSHFRSPPAR